MSFPRNELRISITSSCNMKCVYCHNEGNCEQSILSIESIEKIVKCAKSFGLEEVRLTGGDPLTHPDIYAICEMLHNKYGLRISINTNCVAYQRLEPLINNGWISRVIVGLDYIDAPISKNSPVGVSSEIILNRILEIKKSGCNVSIATVFNNDYDNKRRMVEWCIKNGVRVKIIEIEKNEICDHSDIEYLKMQKDIIESFPFDNIGIDELEEYNCFINGEKIVSFFPSFCRLRRCDLCRKVQLRITSAGILKRCLYYNDGDESIIDVDEEEISKRMRKVLAGKVNYHRDNSLRVRG